MLRSDGINDVDALDRKRFAKEIANNIISYFKTSNDSLVIGIHGPWGSGKSTLLNFIKDELKKIPGSAIAPERNEKRLIENVFAKFKSHPKGGLHILEFNPWMFSGKEELHTKFLNELALKIGNKRQKLRKTIKSLSKKLNWIDDVSKIGSAAISGITQITNVSIDYIKEETNLILIKENIHTVIIMDDVDRLSPVEILEVFQLIKLNANFKNTIFLISFDKSVVSESIKNQYNFDGEKYLEKIVQVDYSLPSILPEDLESIFFERLQSLLDLHQIKFDIKNINAPWLIYGLKHSFKNIRDINRYFNSINFRLPSFHMNVNVQDFLIIEAIRLFDFDSYELIRTNYKELNQFGKHSQFKKEIEKVDQSKSGTLFKYLFEKESRYDNEGRGYRISDPEFFDRYFSLSVSKKDMREEELGNFLKHKETRHNLLDSIISNGKIEFLLRRLSIKSVLPENVDNTELISPLISIWDKHPNEFAQNWRSVWDALKAIISTGNDENIGYHSLIDNLCISSHDFSPARFVFTWLILENIIGEDDKNTDKDLVPFLDLLKSKQESLDNYFKLLLQNYQTHFLYSNSYHILYLRIFLPSFAKYHPDIYKNHFKHLISDDRKIFTILNMLVLRDSTSNVPFGINEKYTFKLLTEELKMDLEDKLEKINLKILTKDDAKTIEMYLKYLKGDHQLDIVKS